MFNWNENGTEDFAAFPPAPACGGTSCPADIHDTVCVQAEVSISPEVTVGKIKAICIGKPVIGPCCGEVEECCRFTVSQNIRVDIPLSFAAHAEVKPRGIACGKPGPEPCQ